MERPRFAAARRYRRRLGDCWFFLGYCGVGNGEGAGQTVPWRIRLQRVISGRVIADRLRIESVQIQSVTVEVPRSEPDIGEWAIAVVIPLRRPEDTSEIVAVLDADLA